MAKEYTAARTSWLFGMVWQVLPFVHRILLNPYAAGG